MGASHNDGNDSHTFELHIQGRFIAETSLTAVAMMTTRGSLMAVFGLDGATSADCIQRDRAANMIFPMPGLLAYTSSFCELLPGDVIATGTPSGVGAPRSPQ